MSILDFKKLSMFRDFTAADMDAAEPFLSSQEYEEGWVLFREGASGRILYIVKRGKVEIIKSLGSPGELVLDLLGPDAIFGEISLMLGLPRSASARIAEKTELVAITSIALDRMTKDKPDLASKIYKLLLNRSLKRTLDLDRRLAHLDRQFRTRESI